MEFDFSQTYLYKMHRLTNTLDTLFDTELRRHANIGLSQFTLLLSVQHHQSASQRTLADFLMVSPGAISREVEIAQKNEWLVIKNGEDRRSRRLILSPIGEAAIKRGILALEQQVFSIFKDENRQTNLMDHIDILQRHINTVDNR